MGPLTPAVISKLPLGLLGFFGIKNGGQYPQTVGNVILPQLDMGEMLAANYHERLGTNIAVAAIGFTALNVVATGLPAVVPQAELWHVMNATAITFTGIGDAITYVPTVRNSQSGSASNYHRALAYEITQAASLNRQTPCTFDNGSRWLVPGDQLGLWVSALTNASGTVQAGVQIAITRFPF